MSPNWLVVFVLFLVTRGCRPFLARPALRHRQLWEEIEYPKKQATKIQYYTILQSQAKPRSAPVGTVFPRAWTRTSIYFVHLFSYAGMLYILLLFKELDIDIREVPLYGDLTNFFFSNIQFVLHTCLRIH